MNSDPVIDLLRRRIGLDPQSLGPAALPCAIAQRMQALGLTASEDYVARLEGDAEEFQVLIGDITVPETWFFRGGDIFQYLAKQVAEIIRPRGSEERVRILTVPCSSGEEPYSLAIAFAEYSVSPTGWMIQAVDLSERQLTRARRGVVQRVFLSSDSHRTAAALLSSNRWRLGTGCRHSLTGSIPPGQFARSFLPLRRKTL